MTVANAMTIAILLKPEEVGQILDLSRSKTYQLLASKALPRALSGLPGGARQTVRRAARADELSKATGAATEIATRSGMHLEGLAVCVRPRHRAAVPMTTYERHISNQHWL